MHDACAGCGASFRRESGFYLGSIYINYGVTVVVTGALYALLVLVGGTTHETALTVCRGDDPFHDRRACPAAAA